MQLLRSQWHADSMVSCTPQWTSELKPLFEPFSVPKTQCKETRGGKSSLCVSICAWVGTLELSGPLSELHFHGCSFTVWCRWDAWVSFLTCTKFLGAKKLCFARNKLSNFNLREIYKSRKLKSCRLHCFNTSKLFQYIIQKCFHLLGTQSVLWPEVVILILWCTHTDAYIVAHFTSPEGSPAI